jgi:hypothetical protein
VSECSRCGQSTDFSPLVLSEILSIIGEGLRVVDSPLALEDLLGRRCPSRIQVLPVAAVAIQLLSVTGDRRRLLEVLAEQKTVARLDEAWSLPAFEREEPDG